MSLGDGGTLIVEFVDNRLTGSGNSAFDLWIFEVGPDIEDTFVAISKDGSPLYDVGKVFGSTARHRHRQPSASESATSSASSG